mmetsp:Transcript_99219/g.285447  ORF Transcript_99219/g.285447 Transcript_99219/m.285447 type:complete len:447 (+) Transcript_99219:66-1406(+)
MTPLPLPFQSVQGNRVSAEGRSTSALRLGAKATTIPERGPQVVLLRFRGTGRASWALRALVGQCPPPSHEALAPGLQVLTQGLAGGAQGPAANLLDLSADLAERQGNVAGHPSCTNVLGRMADELFRVVQLLRGAAAELVDLRGSAAEAVDPTWHPANTQLQTKGIGEVAAIMVDQFVVGARPFASQPRDQGIHVRFRHFRGTEIHRRLVAVLRMATGLGEANATAVVLRKPVAPLTAVDLDSRMEDAANHDLVVHRAPAIDLHHQLLIPDVIDVHQHRGWRQRGHIEELVGSWSPVQQALDSTRSCPGRRWQSRRRVAAVLGVRVDRWRIRRCKRLPLINPLHPCRCRSRSNCSPGWQSRHHRRRRWPRGRLRCRRRRLGWPWRRRVRLCKIRRSNIQILGMVQERRRLRRRSGRTQSDRASRRGGGSQHAPEGRHGGSPRRRWP